MLRPQGERLWRRVAEIVGLQAGQELLEVGSASGEALRVWTAEFGVDGTGAETDGRWVRDAEGEAREDLLGDRLRYQLAPPDDLPFRDASFDVAVGGFALGELANPAPAVGELVRVARSGGTVVLLQWTWAARVSAAKREVLERLLGTAVRPAAEWQGLLHDAGVVISATESLWDIEVPLPEAGLLDRIGVVRNARGAHTLRGLARAVHTDREARLLLRRGNLLGILLIQGTKWPS